jgi:hypothetical protein
MKLRRLNQVVAREAVLSVMTASAAEWERVHACASPINNGKSRLFRSSADRSGTKLLRARSHRIEGTDMHTHINVFDKPIERIKLTCDLMGIADDFERKLSALETHLEGLVADGETNEERLTVRGLSFLKGNFEKPRDLPK